jgi:hypothetical protein
MSFCGIYCHTRILLQENAKKYWTKKKKGHTLSKDQYILSKANLHKKMAVMPTNLAGPYQIPLTCMSPVFFMEKTV